MNKPGSAGLTSDRLGDAQPWVFEDKTASKDALVSGMRDEVIEE